MRPKPAKPAENLSERPKGLTNGPWRGFPAMRGKIANAGRNRLWHVERKNQKIEIELGARRNVSNPRSRYPSLRESFMAPKPHPLQWERRSGRRLQNVDRTGLDFVALDDLILIPPQNTQWHVYARFVFQPHFSLVGNHTCPCTLKGARVDWLVEKCTVCQRLHEMIPKPPVEINDLLHLLSLIVTAKATPVLGALTSLEKEIAGLIIIGPEGG
ncbi:hypothetical protein RJT34_25302 [Clitoria ternatea]|uniref:Uncharacterized protein n=1 Tax=Clitoria ternatea TaxID=43366 RepID=A0AAN9IJW6_CLITE